MTLTHMFLALCAAAIAACLAYLCWFAWQRARWRRAEGRRFERELTGWQGGTHLMPDVGLPEGFVPPSAALAPSPDARVSAALTHLTYGGTKDGAAAMLRLPTAGQACADTGTWCAVTEEYLRQHGWMS